MTYGTTTTHHDLGKWGRVSFEQWDHPHEHRKEFTERDVDYLAQFIDPGDIAVDIGAFTGDTALPMAVASGNRGQVHAFEPNPASLRVLLKNSIANSTIAQTLVYPYAIGLVRDTSIFRYHCNQINGGALTHGDPVTVRRIPLDDLFPMDMPLAFVKIDCEGEDGDLLEHYTQWLRNHGSPVVQVERFPTLNQNQEQQLWKAIVRYGTPSLKDDWTFTELKELPSTLVDIIIKPHA